MITRQDLFNINFYKYLPFHGSYKNLTYRIQKHEIEEKVFDLEVCTWPGPYNFEKTAAELKTFAYFEYSNEGLEKVAAYLTDKIPEYNQ